MISEKDFYRPSEITPTVYQLTEFILPHLDDLRLGCWPTQHRDTGYIDNGKSSTRNCTTSWLYAADLAAEIDDRMSKITDSIALILYYTANPPWELADIARSLHYPDEMELWREMNLMLLYMAKRERRKETYPQWKAKRRYRVSLLNGH